MKGRTGVAATAPQARSVPGARRRGGRRRTAVMLLGIAGLLVVAGIVVRPMVDDAIKEITLPLRHEDVIRQQAADKNLDPALIAAVIYRESKFRDQTSKAGAKGLMQILPDTAHFIARTSGGTEFEEGDLADPQINISYGSWYLRYLLDRYDGNTVAAVAAYNAGHVTRRPLGREGPDRRRHPLRRDGRLHARRDRQARRVRAEVQVRAGAVDRGPSRPRRPPPAAPGRGRQTPARARSFRASA